MTRSDRLVHIHMYTTGTCQRQGQLITETLGKSLRHGGGIQKGVRMQQQETESQTCSCLYPGNTKDTDATLGTQTTPPGRMPRKTGTFLQTATTCLLVFFRSHGHHGVT